MPGNARSSQFMLSTATVMVGKLTELAALNPDDHSLGLVKDVQFNSEPTFVNLTQGLRNTVAMSVKTAEGIRITFNVHEFTPKNLAYAATLDGSANQWTRLKDVYTLSANVTANSNTVVLSGNVQANFTAGDWIFVQKGEDDVAHIGKIANVANANGNTTLTFANGWNAPKAIEAAVGRVGKVHKQEVGRTMIQPEFAMKITGLMPKDNKPFTIMVPKAKIVRGLSVSFMTDNFSGMPFEVEPSALMPDDDMYAEFGDSVAVLFPH
jgi:hypothetical protein